MASYLIITIIADDKPGLVGLLSETIAQHSGNWLESQMSHLAGKFAGILRVRVENSEADALIKDLEGLSATLRLVVERVSAEPESPRQRTVSLSLVGNDRPGIVKEISRALANEHVNMDKLTTDCTSAPMSGEPLFNAKALLHIPESLDIAQLQSQLERLADDLIVEISLESN
ncbi:MAG: ACT domain-containing protein [Pseudohongiellaceae bacterium]|nr:ACT domain-containing protein [Pseudohongiellaceae bacterium]